MKDDEYSYRVTTTTEPGCLGCLFLALLFAIMLGGCILIWQEIRKNDDPPLRLENRPKPTDDFLVCMDCGRRISLFSPEDDFKVNAIIRARAAVETDGRFRKSI